MIQKTIKSACSSPNEDSNDYAVQAGEQADKLNEWGDCVPVGPGLAHQP